MTEPRIETLEEKKLIGISLKMSLSNNKTGQLWGQFGPQIKGIQNRTNQDKISMQIYDPAFFQRFNPVSEFEKWATVEVQNFDHLPEGMKPFTLEGGLYAVFAYRGSSSESYHFFNHIFGTWIPASPYQIDNRPHFELLGENYKNNDPDSEEEIWIPIVKKNI